jgi:hypothetical protein
LATLTWQQQQQAQMQEQQEAWHSDQPSATRQKMARHGQQQQQ